MPAALTGAALIERLRYLLDARSDEDLAALLGVPLRRVSRIRRGFGPNQQPLIDMLVVAGWLDPGVDLTPEESQARAKAYRKASRLRLELRRRSQAKA